MQQKSCSCQVEVAGSERKVARLQEKGGGISSSSCSCCFSCNNWPQQMQKSITMAIAIGSASTASHVPICKEVIASARNHHLEPAHQTLTKGSFFSIGLEPRVGVLTIKYDKAPQTCLCYYQYVVSSAYSSLAKRLCHQPE